MTIPSNSIQNTAIREAFINAQNTTQQSNNTPITKDTENTSSMNNDPLANIDPNMMAMFHAFMQFNQQMQAGHIQDPAQRIEPMQGVTAYQERTNNARIRSEINQHAEQLSPEAKGELTRRMHLADPTDISASEVAQLEQLCRDTYKSIQDSDQWSEAEVEDIIDNLSRVSRPALLAKNIQRTASGGVNQFIRAVTTYQRVTAAIDRNLALGNPPEWNEQHQDRADEARQRALEAAHEIKASEHLWATTATELTGENGTQFSRPLVDWTWSVRNSLRNTAIWRAEQQAREAQLAAAQRKMNAQPMF